MEPNGRRSDQSSPLKHQRSLVQRFSSSYGWLVVFGATICIIMVTPGQMVGIAVFLDSFIADLHLSRSMVTLLFAIGTLVGASLLPFAGTLIDKRGPRAGVILITSLFALASVFMGQVRGVAMLLFGFILIRSLGQGALSLVSIHVVNLWFVRKRGLAIGLVGLGSALATATFPAFIEFLINSFTWRLAYAILGGLIATTALPIGALLFRGPPEEYGLVPDNSVPPAEAQNASSETNVTAAQSRRTVTFWLFAISDFWISALSTGLILHHYSIMAANGIDREIASTVFLPIGLVTALANLSAGLLLDRFATPKALLVAMLLVLSLSLNMAMWLSTPWLAIGYGGLLGLIKGMQYALQGTVYARYFGRRHLGSIRGLANSVLVTGTALGPLLFAVGADYFHSFAPVLVVCSAIPIILVLFAFAAKLPAHQNR